MRYKIRPKKIQTLIDEANKYFEVNSIKDETDSLFVFMCGVLLKKKMYQGFNYYVHKEFSGTTKLVLAGTYKKELFDCLQLY